MARRGWMFAGCTVAVVLGAPGAWYWFYGPCGVKRVEDSVTRLRSEADKWKDALQVAASTPLIAVAGPVARLQEIRRETKEMAVASCTEHARNLFVRSMEVTIEAFLGVMGSSFEQRDAAQRNLSMTLRHQGRRNYCAAA